MLSTRSQPLILVISEPWAWEVWIWIEDRQYDLAVVSTFTRRYVKGYYPQHLIEIQEFCQARATRVTPNEQLEEDLKPSVASTN